MEACTYEFLTMVADSVYKVVIRSFFWGVIRLHTESGVHGRFTTLTQGCIRILNGNSRTGAFHQMPITANYTSCCVNNS